MVGSSLLESTAQNLRAGQKELATCMKHFVASEDSPIVKLLDYSDDRVFLEPSLFTYFSHKNSRVTLDQLLYGYLPNPRLLPKFTAYADEAGNVYLPQRGIVSTNDRDAPVTLDESIVKDQVNGLSRINGTQIEHVVVAHPLLEFTFRDAAGRRLPFEFDSTSKETETIDRACNILRFVAPALFDCLINVTRNIVTYRSDERRSFATVSSHGTAFLNVPSQPSEIFFIEDLTHQAGHILCTALTVDREKHFLTQPDTPLRRFTGEQDEHRDLYTAFHGVYTEALICIALHCCIEEQSFGGIKLHELIGRLSFVMKRFQLDLLSLQDEGMFTESGRGIIDACGLVFDEVFAGPRDRIMGANLSNQSYTFSYELYQSLNPA